MSNDVFCVSMIGCRFPNKKILFALPSMQQFVCDGKIDRNLFDNCIEDLGMQIWEDYESNSGCIAIGKQLSDVDIEEYEQVNTVYNIQSVIEEFIEVYKTLPFAEDINEPPAFHSFLFCLY